MSIYILDETMTPFKWLGIFTIISGIVLIGYGSNRSTAGSAEVV